MVKTSGIRAWNRLEWRLAVGVSAVLTLVFLTYLAVGRASLRRVVSAQVIAESERVMDRLVGAVRARGLDDMAGLNRPIALGAMDLVSFMVLSSEGRVLIASDSAMEGEVLSVHRPLCVECHTARGKPALVMGVLNGSQVMRLIRPLSEVSGCGRCHAGSSFRAGYLVCDYDFAPLLSASRAELKRDVWLFAGSLLVIAFGILTFTRRLVTRRIRCLEQKAAAIVHGARTEVPCMGGTDEIAALAGSLEAMSDHLHDAIAQLEQRRDYLHHMLEKLEDGLLIIDQDRRVKYANDRLRRILNLAASDLAAETQLQRWSSVDTPLSRIVALCEPVFESGTGLSEVLRFGRHGEDAQHLEVHAGLLDLSWDSSREVLVSVRDISSRVALQDQFYRAEKLATIGQLAAGVAHEINNPMACVLACAEGLQMAGAAADARRAEYLDIISSSARRCREITRRLLNYSAHADIEVGPTDLMSALEEALAVTQFEAERRRVHVEVRGRRLLPPVEGTHDLLVQVFVDLLLNAIQAAGSPGDVDIEVVRDARSVHVYVSDNGPGVAPDLRARIFDPFFTTKPVGEGTGLGLSVSQGIVRQMGGSLQLVSRRSGWTSFGATVPLSADTETAEVGHA